MGKPLRGIWSSQKVPAGGADDDGRHRADLQKALVFLPRAIFRCSLYFITAFIVALIAIKTFLQLIKRISFILPAIHQL